jgi:hypothetical protein
MCVERSRRPDRDGGAWFDVSGRYRYLLWRMRGRWRRSHGFVLFVMLNPSTADEDANDPTVERCERRAMAMGFDGLVVANLFAWRATDPHELAKASQPIGPENDSTLAGARLAAVRTICAWGANGFAIPRAEHAHRVLRTVKRDPLWCLGLTASGQPRHPLYVSYSVQPLVWQ